MARRQRKNKPNGGQRVGRIFILLIGLLFISWGLLSVGLGLFGERGEAVITHIRREGGERNETIRGRYTYVVAYAFTLPDGRRVVGSTKKIGGAVYLKATGTSRKPVRYYDFFPYINALEEDTGLRTGPLVIFFVGGLLIWFMQRAGGRR
ncbi:MAG: hypothetical protein PHI97_27810 [Desulfobulbus sp.]|nr:hypothetical protein [Desulfobulbus sp.]